MHRNSSALLPATVLLLAFSVAGCALFGGPSRDMLRSQAADLDRKARESYFYDWPAAVESARQAIALDAESIPLSRFIVGEALYLAGEQEEAFPYFLAALRGENSLIALASRFLIRDFYVSRSIALDLAATEPRCDTLVCRGVIASEAIEWARATLRSWEQRRIERHLSWPREWRLFRASDRTSFRDLAAVSPEEEAYRNRRSFIPPDARVVTLSETGSAFDLQNHFSPVRNSVFFAAATISVDEDQQAVFLPYIAVPHRLYVDGAVVIERDADRLTAGLVSGVVPIRLSRGEHTLLLKLAPYLSEQGYATVPWFHVADARLPDGADIGDRRDGDDPLTAYLRLLVRDLLFGDVHVEDWEDWYATVSGSRAPAPLFWIARLYRRAGEGQRAVSLLSFLVKEWPALVMVKSDLIESCQDTGDEACVRETIASEDGNDRNELVWLLRLSDVYYGKKWYAKDVENAAQLVKRYGRYPVAYYYLSDAWRALGDTRRAARVRQRALAAIPAYQPTWSRLAELYRETGDLPALITTARKLVEMDPYRTEYRRMLGEAYLADASWGKAEQEFRTTIAHNPESAALWMRLGDVLALQGRSSEAVAAFRRAYELAPEEPEYAERLDAFGGVDLRFFRERAVEDAAVDAKIAEFRRHASDYPQRYTIIYDEGIRQVYYNGSSRSRFRLVIALNTEEGVREFATVSNYGRILSARVVKPDGRTVPTWRADAEYLYFLDTEPGDVIDFTIESLEGPRSWLGGSDFRWFFATEGIFNLHSRLVVRFPYDMPVTFFVRGAVQRSERQEEGMKEFLFETNGLFQPSAEPMMPPMSDVLPLLSYTTAASWNDFARWQALFIREQSSESTAIARFVESTTASVSDPHDRIAILRDWVARQVRYLSNDKGIDALRPAPVEKTFNEKAGDCKDKALLLKTMLSSAGVTAHYALVKSRQAGTLWRDFPAMQFDHALVFIPPQKGISEGFFVDPTAGYDHSSGINPLLEGTDAFVIDDQTGGYRFEKVERRTAGMVSLIVDAEGRVRISLTGSAASTARYRFAADGDPFAFLAEIVSRAAGGPIAVTQCTLVSGQYDEPFESACMSRPFVPALVTAVLKNLVELQERRYPLLLFDRIGRWQAEVMPCPAEIKPTEVDNEFFRWYLRKESGACKAVLEMKTIEIPADRYAAFRDAVTAALVLENRVKGDAP